MPKYFFFGSEVGEPGWIEIPRRTKQVEEVPAHPVLGLPVLVQKQVGEIAEHGVERVGNRDHNSEPQSETET